MSNSFKFKAKKAKVIAEWKDGWEWVKYGKKPRSCKIVGSDGEQFHPIDLWNDRNIQEKIIKELNLRQRATLRDYILDNMDHGNGAPVICVLVEDPEVIFDALYNTIKPLTE